MFQFLSFNISALIYSLIASFGISMLRECSRSNVLFSVGIQNLSFSTHSCTICSHVEIVEDFWVHLDYLSSSDSRAAFTTVQLRWLFNIEQV